MEDCRSLFDSNLIYNINHIIISSNPSKEVMEELSLFARKVDKLTIVSSEKSNIWLNSIMLSRWKLQEIILVGTVVNKVLLTFILQTCTELTSITLGSNTVDDVVVMAVAQHCPKLQSLCVANKCVITFNALLALSEQCLLLEELDIPSIPNIPTADIARRCSHALSCIRHLNIGNLHQNNQEGTILIPYMTGLNSADLGYYCRSYIPLLTQYCHKLTNIGVAVEVFLVSDLLSLCYANPLLEEFRCYYRTGITDSALIELIHACLHLHTLRLPYDTDITDIGILTLCEHCPQLQWLDITHCKQVTETALLQLLQCCYKLTRLYVSSSSLLKETWTQLDRNTQKRVIRW